MDAKNASFWKFRLHQRVFISGEHVFWKPDRARRDIAQELTPKPHEKWNIAGFAGSF